MYLRNTQNSFSYFFIVLIVLISPAIFCQSVHQQPVNGYFRLEGHFTGNQTKIIHLSYVNAQGKKISKTEVITNGRFDFEGAISEPTEALLKGELDTTDWAGDPNSTTLLIEPTNMQIKVREGRFKKARLSGSCIQTKYDLLLHNEAPIHNKINSLEIVLGQLNDSLGIALKNKDSGKIKEVMRKRAAVFHHLTPYQTAIKQARLQFIRAHPAANLSAYLIYRNFLNSSFGRDSVKSLINELALPVQNNYWVKKSRLWLNYKTLVPIGSTLPVIDGVGIQGQQVKTSSLIKQRYTLIIFWASWCPPCRALSSLYKTFYRRYHAKGLDIIAITQDFHQQAWHAAIRQDETADFIHIYPAKVNQISDIFGLHGIPSDILLMGKEVIGKYNGASYDGATTKDLQKKLNAIFETDEVTAASAAHSVNLRNLQHSIVDSKGEVKSSFKDVSFLLR